MRKTSLLWIIFIFLLLGCKPESNEVPDDTKTPVETIIIPSDEVFEFKTLDVIDIADQFDFPEQTLTFYQNPSYEGIPYIDLDEFMEMISLGLSPFTVEKNDHFNVHVTLYAEDDLTHLKTITLSIDPIKNQLIYTDFNFNLAIASSSDLSYETDLVVIDYTSTETQSLFIDLNPYGIDLLYHDNSFYIPFDLANLILTGYSLSLYSIGDSLYIFDNVYNLSSHLSDNLLKAPTNSKPMIDFTTRFTALLFDYFYGLKDYHDVDSYLETFDQLGFDESQTLSTLSGKIQKFVYDTDDLHTSINDYGYDRENMSNLITPPLYSKTVEYFNQYLYHCAFQTPDDLVMTEYTDGYVLQIKSFNLETKDKLATVFEDIDSSKDIFIDLSCNSGGTVISTVELLTYMTNDPITINYMNTTTQTLYTETYQSKTPRALSNRFFVVTTRLTYSAANLFTSIVSDMDLAMVIGRPTMGGAAAIGLAVLPNNLVMSYSTPIVFLNQNHEIIEDGIQPDVTMDAYKKVGQIIAESIAFFSHRASFDLANDSTMEKLKIDFNLLSTPTNLLIDGFTVEYIDFESKVLVERFETNDIDFSVDELVTHTSKLIEVRITAHYTYFGRVFDEVIYQDFIDELKDTMDNSTMTLPFGVKYETTKHHDDDIDYIRLVIEEADVYRIILNDLYAGSNTCRIYAEDGTQINGRWHFALQPGVYYLWVNLNNLGFNYTIQVDQMYDDNIGATYLDVQEGTQSVTLTYNFEYDLEWISFTLPEEMLITLTSTDYIMSTFYITNDQGIKYHSGSDYLHFSSPYKFVLPRGTFMLKFHENMAGTITIHFEASIIPGDLSGDETLVDQRFGILEEGPLLLNFEEAWDRDIYVFETDDEVEIMFDDIENVFVCLILEGGNNCDLYQKALTLQPGTHYFSFMSKSITHPFQPTINVIVLNDLSDENRMIPIVLDIPFEVIIEKDGDIDYYTLSVPHFAVYKLSMINGHSSRIEIYDLFGNKLYTGYYGSIYFQLVPGEYIIEISSNTSNQTYVDRYITTVSIDPVDDQEPNIIGFDVSYYQTLTGDNTYLNRVTGTLGYEGDIDFFLVILETSGVFQFSSLSDVSFYLIDANGAQTKLRNNWTYQLDAGTYYIRASSGYSNASSIIEYDFMFYKKS